MRLTIKNVNLFLFFKLPIAWWSGVRVQSFSDDRASCVVSYKWINQNPFKSMFWAVQGMAAELSTGVILMSQIQKYPDKKISMLVVEQSSVFYKKAVGKITFQCTQGKVISDSITKAIETQESQVFYLTSEGIDEQGDTVSCFKFKWSIYYKFF